MKIRLFVALEVPDDVRDGVDTALRAVRPRQPGLRWTDPGSWHITLVFVGWVAEDRAHEVAAAAKEAAAASSPFELRLDGRLGTFGRRVLWVGLEPSPQAQALVTHLRGGLVERGFDVEDRGFAPHLTVARAARGERVRSGFAVGWEGPDRAWEADRVVVMRSHLARAAGSRYERWAVAELAG